MPPDYVTQWLPAEVVGVVAVLAAIWWGVVVLRKAWAKVHRTVDPWVEWFKQFRRDWEGTPERTTSDGFVLHPAEPGVPQRLAVYDERIAAMAEAMERNDARQERNDARQEELRKLVVQAMAEIGYVRRDMIEALRHNHPDYKPPLTRDFADRFDD